MKTVKNVLESNSPTVASLARKFGKETVLIYLELWILDLNESTNVKTKMTPGQIEMTAQAIFDTYSLKISDLAYFFNQVKNGAYGGFYENLGREKIMEWLAKYYDDRCEIAQTVSNKKHNGFSATKDKIDSKVIEKMFEGVGKEKIEHNHEKSTIGLRMRNTLQERMKLKISLSSKEQLLNWQDDVAKGVDGVCDFISYQQIEEELYHRK